MTWLVTGAAGFAGRHLLDLLATFGERIVGVGHDADIELELRQPEDVDRVVAAVRPDRVVHLAGTSSREQMARDPTGGTENITLPVVHLLDALLRHAPRARALIVTPFDVYGQSPTQPIPESAPLRPRDLYGAAWASASYLSRRHVAAGLAVVTTRTFSYTGPDDGLSAVAGWRRLHADGNRIRLADPTMVRDWSDVRDVVSAYALLAETGEAGAAYNVGSGVGRATEEVVAALCPGAVVVSDPSLARKNDVPTYVADVTRLRDVGWRPRYRWEQTVAAVRESR